MGGLILGIALVAGVIAFSVWWAKRGGKRSTKVCWKRMRKCGDSQQPNSWQCSSCLCACSLSIGRMAFGRVVSLTGHASQPHLGLYQRESQACVHVFVLLVLAQL